MHLNVKLMGGQMPTREPGSAGYDLYATEDVTVDPLQRRLVMIGIRTEFADGCVGLIRDRSGLAAKKGITVLGGTIDASYRGEWGVILYNTSHEPLRIGRGDRIAQVVFVMHESPDPCLVEGELPESVRGSGGFGSTGK